MGTSIKVDITENGDIEEKKKRTVNDGILYTVNETPPWYECLLLGFQHYLSIFVATLAIPNVLGPGLCLGEDNVGKAEITGTIFFVSGFVTVFQSIFGVRLPIVQGGTFALMSPTLSYLSLPHLTCPTIINDLSQNITLNDTAVLVGSPEHREVWQSRLRTIQGSMMVASLLEIVLGFSGLLGFLLRYIGPLVICPTISLLGLSLSSNAASMGAHQWWICLSTILLMIIFSQYLGGVNVPCLIYSRKNNGCTSKPYPVFKMFPVILGAGLMWLICFILTVTNVLPKDPTGWGYGARTDIRSADLNRSPWARVPYPGQWGVPNIDMALVLGLFAGFISSIVESVGDYHACARLAGAPVPPTHAINRGIGIEGIGCLLAGAFGTGNGTTSASINVGVIGLTKVGSRVVVLYTAAFMIILAVFNKFGALFITIPDPIIGGTFFLLFGMIVAVGISNLQYVDMNSSRNLFVFGFSFFLGVTIPEWVGSNPTAIQTGVQLLNSTLTVLLKTSMFVGGVTAFILDNTIPGTRKERGLAEDPDGDIDQTEENLVNMTYDIPFCSSSLRKSKITRYIPFCPGFGRRSKETEAADDKPEIQVISDTDAAETSTVVQRIKL